MKLTKAIIVKTAKDLKITATGTFTEIATRICEETGNSHLTITRSTVKFESHTLNAVEFLAAVTKPKPDSGNPRIAPVRTVPSTEPTRRIEAKKAELEKWDNQKNLIRGAICRAEIRILEAGKEIPDFVKYGDFSEAELLEYLMKIVPSKEPARTVPHTETPNIGNPRIAPVRTVPSTEPLAKTETGNTRNAPPDSTLPAPAETGNPRVAPTRNASKNIAVPGYIRTHHRNERGCEMSQRLLPINIIMGTQEAFDFTPETGTVLAITDGCIHNDNHETHNRGRNWIATVESDMTSPGGLSRDWWDKVSGNSEYFEVPADLHPGMYIEMAGDYYTASGKKRPDRSYYKVTAVGTESISVIEIDEDEVGKYTPGPNAIYIPEIPETEPEIESLRAEIESLREENAELRQEIESLRAAQEIPTPAERYFAEKARFGDDDPDVLVYKMGDFYEIMGADARELAPKLKITATLVNDELAIGFPVYNAPRILGKITAAGRSYRLYPPPSGITLTDADHAELDEAASEIGDYTIADIDAAEGARQIEMIEDRFNVSLNQPIYESCVKNLEDFTDEEFEAEMERRGIKQAAPATPTQQKRKKSGGKKITAHVLSIIENAGEITMNALISLFEEVMERENIISTWTAEKLVKNRVWNLCSPKGANYKLGVRKNGDLITHPNAA